MTEHCRVSLLSRSEPAFVVSAWKSSVIPFPLGSPPQYFTHHFLAASVPFPLPPTSLHTASSTQLPNPDLQLVFKEFLFFLPKALSAQTSMAAVVSFSSDSIRENNLFLIHRKESFHQLLSRACCRPGLEAH